MYLVRLEVPVEPTLDQTRASKGGFKIENFSSNSSKVFDDALYFNKDIKALSGNKELKITKYTAHQTLTTNEVKNILCIDRRIRAPRQCILIPTFSKNNVAHTVERDAVKSMAWPCACRSAPARHLSTIARDQLPAQLPAQLPTTSYRSCLKY
jgi:hypothetical protein